MHGDDREVRNLGEEEVIRLERFVRQHIAGDVQDLKGRQVVDHVWKKVKILNLLVKKIPNLVFKQITVELFITNT
jgi:hypothetical protein